MTAPIRPEHLQAAEQALRRCNFYSDGDYIHANSTVAQLLADTEAAKAAEIARLKAERDELRANPLGVDSPCGGCGGSGRKVYSNTTSFMGGIGGQTITDDVCDRCWGTGDSEHHGRNLRTLFSNTAAVSAEYAAAVRALAGVRPKYGHFCPVLLDERRYGHTDACIEAERVLSTPRARAVLEQGETT